MIASPAQLNYFIVVSNTLNLTRAAEKLSISQPSLSMALKQLEHIMGVPLFLRHKRGVTLTAAGRLLLTRAKELMQHWEKIKSTAQSSYNQVQGRVSLGCHLSVALYCIPKFLPFLIKNHQKLEVSMNHGFSYNLIEKIIKFEIDIGILVNPLKQSDLIINKLYNDFDAFWYVANNKNILKSKDLVILCDKDRIQTQALLKKCKERAINYARIITSSSLEMLATLTVAGMGVGILPERVVTMYSDKLRPLPNLPTYQNEICLVYRHENKDVKAIKTIVDAIKEYFKKEKHA